MLLGKNSSSRTDAAMSKLVTDRSLTSLVLGLLVRNTAFLHSYIHNVASGPKLDSYMLGSQLWTSSPVDGGPIELEANIRRMEAAL